MRRRPAPVRLSVLIALVVASLVTGSGGASPTPQPDGPEPIYRIRVRLLTTALAARVVLGRPGELIQAAVHRSRGERVAEFQGFGRGVRVARRGTASRAVAGFVAALTPGGGDRIRFRMGQVGPGTTSVRLWNLNQARADPVTRYRLRGGSRTFSVPIGRVAAGGPTPGTAPLPPQVLAFYYPWYQPSDWDGGKPMATYNQTDSPYSSADPAALDRHVQQAQQAGIDGFIVSWWGQEPPWDQNTRLLEERLPPGFSFALYLETFSKHLRTEDDLIRQIDYALHTYATSPRYLHYQGRPVLYGFSTHNVLMDHGAGNHPQYAEVWRRVLAALALKGHHPVVVGEGRPFDVGDFDVFDGMHVYGTTDPGTTAALNRRMSLTARAWAAVHGGLRRIWGSSILPGYDDRHIPGRRPDHFPRQDGLLYQEQWEAAIEAHSDQALIVSFNEWLETTNIEPNLEWGDRYLDLTASLAARYRASR